MIIISNRPGQLGNLIFIYANFLAYGLENSISVSNPSFYSYKNYFTFTSGFSFSKNKIFYTFCYYFARILFKLKIKTTLITSLALNWSETVNLDHAPQLNSSLCFVQGWLFRSDKLVLKHKKKIVAFFTPAEKFKNQLTSFFSQFNKNEFLIGIHIRLGDYKTFENGKYHYSTDDYLNAIKQLALLFKDRDPHFIVCSNEKVNLNTEEIQELKITYGPGHELLDMYCLASCHHIAGPPSTYTMWASFYGNVPLYVISDIKKGISINDFKIQLA